MFLTFLLPLSMISNAAPAHSPFFPILSLGTVNNPPVPCFSLPRSMSWALFLFQMSSTPLHGLCEELMAG